MPEKKEFNPEDFKIIIPKLKFDGSTSKPLILSDDSYNLDLKTKSQIQVWREVATNNGTLYSVAMNEELAVDAKLVTKATFYTNGFHGCVFYLTLESGKIKFGHIDPVIALNRLPSLLNFDPTRSVIIAPDIPEFYSLNGSHIKKYAIDLNPQIDSFAESMALQESPELNSVAVHITQNESGFSGYVNAFQKAPDSKWYVPYYPQEIAQRIELIL